MVGDDPEGEHLIGRAVALGTLPLPPFPEVLRLLGRVLPDALGCQCVDPDRVLGCALGGYDLVFADRGAGALVPRG